MEGFKVKQLTQHSRLCEVRDTATQHLLSHQNAAAHATRCLAIWARSLEQEHDLPFDEEPLKSEARGDWA